MLAGKGNNMKNTGIILILKEIYQNIYVISSDKYKLFNAMFEEESYITGDIKPLALIYRSNAFHIKRYRIECLDKLKYQILANIFETEEAELDPLTLGRLMFELFEYFEYSKKHLKTKYNSSYYSIYISQLNLFDKKKVELNIVREKRKQARAKASERPNAYGRLANDSRIKHFDKKIVNEDYIKQAKINFAKFWSFAPMEQKNKASCKRLFIADTELNSPFNIKRFMVNLTLYKGNYDFTNTNTFEFLINEKELRTYYQATYDEVRSTRKIMEQNWINPSNETQ